MDEIHLTNRDSYSAVSDLFQYQNRDKLQIGTSCTYTAATGLLYLQYCKGNKRRPDDPFDKKLPLKIMRV